MPVREAVWPWYRYIYIYVENGSNRRQSPKGTIKHADVLCIGVTKTKSFIPIPIVLFGFKKEN